MSGENLEAVRLLARDLRRERPSSSKEQLGGFELAARALDKCRASLVGWQGDYEFNCPLDRRLFARTGIRADAFREFVATGATDIEVGAWLRKHAQMEREGLW